MSGESITSRLRAAALKLTESGTEQEIAGTHTRFRVRAARVPGFEVWRFVGHPDRVAIRMFNGPFPKVFEYRAGNVTLFRSGKWVDTFLALTTEDNLQNATG